MGLSSQTSSQQIIYAAYEAICYQTRQLLESLEKDCKIWPKLKKIVVGGEISENTFLLQLMADLCGIKIERPQISNPACLGAMLAAGLSTNIFTLDNFGDSCVPPIDILQPTMNENRKILHIVQCISYARFKFNCYISEKDMKYQNWLSSVRKCLNFSQSCASDIQSQFLYETEGKLIHIYHFY